MSKFVETPLKGLYVRASSVVAVTSRPLAAPTCVCWFVNDLNEDNVGCYCGFGSVEACTAERDAFLARLEAAQ